MNIQIFGTKKCNDTKKAERFFKERGIKYQFIDMKEKGMSKGEFMSEMENSLRSVTGRRYGRVGTENIEQKRQEDIKMERVVKFLKEAETYYLATVEGDQPRVRPFGTAHIFEGKLYIQTGKAKEVSKQLHANPKAEICAFKNGEWLRVAGELVEDDRREARQSMLDAYPSLQKMYSADDGNTEVFYFKNATATFSSFTHAPEVVKF